MYILDKIQNVQLTLVYIIKCSLSVENYKLHYISRAVKIILQSENNVL